jgi:SAM-dependent methyltransferase
MEALRYPASQVTALDLSRTSLDHGMRMAKKLGAANIDYLEADILDLDKLEQTFDVVECTGVLHHMADPMAGWRALKRRLATGGVMKIALYSTLARRRITEVRQGIEARQLTPEPANIRDVRRHILGLGAGHPHRAVTEFSDFYSISGCRDLLFNVQEHTSLLPGSKPRWTSLGLPSSASKHPATGSKEYTVKCSPAMGRGPIWITGPGWKPRIRTPSAR